MQSASARAIRVLSVVLFGLGPVSGQQPGSLVDFLPTSSFASAHPVAVLEGSVLFGYDSSARSELWVSDGTVAGTRILVGYLRAGAGTKLGGKAYFSGSSATISFPMVGVPGLWVSDGTGSGTREIATSGLFQISGKLVTFDGAIVFPAVVGYEGDELYRYKPTTGVTLVKNIAPGQFESSNPRGFTVVGDTLYFTVSSATVQTALWRTDGTEIGTVKVANLPARPSESVVFRDDLYLVVEDANAGVELWKSDGTEAGTGLFADIRPGVASSSPRHLVEADGFLYFSADDGKHGAELWRTDGTQLGTVLVADVHETGSSAPSNLTATGGGLYFTATTPGTGRELWQSSGSGAQLVTEVEPGPGGMVHGIHVAGDSTIYLAAITSTARGLWVKREKSSPVPLTFGANVGWLPPMILGATGGKLLVVAGTTLWGVETGGLSRSFGSGCGSAPGTTPLLTSGRPVLGRLVRTCVSRAPAKSPGVLRIGVSPSTPIRVIDGCRLFVDPVTTASVQAFTTNAAGVGILSLAMPLDQSLVGVAIAHQAELRTAWLPRPVVSRRSNGLLMIPGRW